MTNNTYAGAFPILQRLTELALQKLGKKVLSAKNNLIFVQEQIDALTGFKQEYLMRVEDLSRQGMNSDQYQNYQSFLTSLDQSILKQSVAVEHYKKEFEKLSSQLNALVQKKILYKKIIEKKRSLQITDLNKKEQKMTDNYAQENLINRVSKLVA